MAAVYGFEGEAFEQVIKLGVLFVPRPPFLFQIASHSTYATAPTAINGVISRNKHHPNVLLIILVILIIWMVRIKRRGID
jgi:hypothetical protein